MEKLNFNELKEEIIKLLENIDSMVLATSFKNKVSARTMNVINIELDIFCQTDGNFLKIEQIEQNPNVALCMNNIQIEGVAKIKGHPLATENKKFIEEYRIKHKTSFERYSNIKSEIVIEIEPKMITLWKRINNRSCRDFLDLHNNNAVREFYHY
jgi:general stress protein 26